MTLVHLSEPPHKRQTESKAFKRVFQLSLRALTPIAFVGSKSSSDDPVAKKAGFTVYWYLLTCSFI